MGTRGFLGVAVEGQLKLAYNHFDSYPGGLGAEVLGDLRQAQEQFGEGWLRVLREQARQLQVVDEQTRPTSEQVDRLRRFADTGVDDGRLDNWYVLTRTLQGHLLATLAAGILVDASSFPYDSLFCEWGYLVDFDPDIPLLEVYQGFQQTPPKRGRWAGRQRDREYAEDIGPYYAVELVQQYSLLDLPSAEQLAAECDPPEVEELEA
jgi:hypothetical protein